MRRRLLVVGSCVGIPIVVLLSNAISSERNQISAKQNTQLEPAGKRDRSPVDVILTKNEKWLLTANQTSNTISVVDVATGKIAIETACGNRPSALVLTPDEKRLLVSATFAGELQSFAFDNGILKKSDSLYLGFEPRGIAISPDGKLAYVALTTAKSVSVVDLDRFAEVGRIPVGTWPRYLTLSPDGSRLAVGVNGEGGVAVVDTESRKRLYIDKFAAINLGQMQASRDGKYAYVPWMVYRHNPITPGNIRLGWVLASRIARVRLDEHYRREAIALDPRGKAVADPHGIALSPNEDWLVCTASGTQELLVYQIPGLPFQDYGGPGDHIDAKLLKANDRFFRISLGGRPMAVRYARDGKHVYIANYMLNAVQVVDVPGRKVVRTIDLGGPETPSIARKGEALFYDGRRSLDQWYSCHSCHYEGHTNSRSMDTRNDGRFGNFKMVLSLRNVTRTGPWTWHGWQKSLEDSVHRSFTQTMLGPAPTDDETKAVIAFLDTLDVPPNPHKKQQGSFAESVKRGEQVFRSAKAGCLRCHQGKYLTKPRIYDVGLGVRGDAYRGFNPPSLLGIYDRYKYLHDGRAMSLEEVLRGPHSPNRVTGAGELSEREMDDLLNYLKAL